MFSEWPDPDRRDAALTAILLRVHAQRDPFEEGSALTKPEVRCLQAAAVGLQDKEIADVLGLSYWMAKEHLQDARRRLRAKNTTHACCKALRRGLIR